MRFKLALLAFSVQFAFLPTLQAQTETTENQTADIERLTVQGDFRQSSMQKLAGSVVLLSQADLQRQSAQHLEDVLQQLANVNFAAGASRGRFLQVRGVGERSEFVDTINPSVGLLLDGIDYSVLGLPSLLDVQQLEVFRGPEASRFGASAMAGMLNVLTHEPQFASETQVGATFANYHSHQLSLIHNSPFNAQWAGRIAVEQQRSDGFIYNQHLNRKDTNGIDERHVQAKLKFLASDDLTLDAVVHWHDVDNGYDAFSLDRNRTTLSDEPGQDQQDIRAGALKAAYRGFAFADAWTQVSVLNAQSDYGFDEDWSFQSIHPWAYSTTDQYLRDRRSYTLDQRFSAKDLHWTSGFYASSQTTDLTRNYGDSFEKTLTVFQSELKRQHVAWYGDYQHALHTDLTLTSGLRVERYADEYKDSHLIHQQEHAWMWGAKLSVDYQVAPQTMLYLLGSRGYKVGGVNGEALAKALDPAFIDIAAQLQSHPTFAPETLWNAEFGVKGATAEHTLVSRIAAFYMWRTDMQVNSWINRGTKFIGYLANAGSGRNYGVEMENRLQLNPTVQVFLNASWLQSEIRDFFNNEGVNMTGREQAHAPQLQASVAFDWQLHQNWTATAGWQHKDAFYYSDSHDAKSQTMNLINLALSYHRDELEIKVWSRNAFDETYGVRGFYFGNDPRDGYEDHVYEQFGEPRRIGISVRYQF